MQLRSSIDRCVLTLQSGGYDDCWLDLDQSEQIALAAWCTTNWWLWPGNNIYGCMKVPPLAAPYAVQQHPIRLYIDCWLDLQPAHGR